MSYYNSMITVKLYFLGEIKKFTVMKSALTYAMLVDRVRSHFGPNVCDAVTTSALRLKYQDCQLESVTVENEVPQHGCLHPYSQGPTPHLGRHFGTQRICACMGSNTIH